VLSGDQTGTAPFEKRDSVPRETSINQMNGFPCVNSVTAIVFPSGDRVPTRKSVTGDPMSSSALPARSTH
jgi:hypothetical protein